MMSAAEPLADFGRLSREGNRENNAKLFARGPLRPVALASTRTRITTGGLSRTFGILDAGILLLCFVVTESVGGAGLKTATFVDVLPGLTALWLTALMLGPANTRVFAPHETLVSHLAKVAGTVVVATLTGHLVALLAGAGRPAMGVWATLTFSGLLMAHTGWWFRVRRWRAQGRMTPNIVVVGATPNARKLIELALETRDVAVLGVFDDRLARSPSEISGVPVLGDTAALLAHPLLPYVDKIVITVAPWAQTRVRDLIDRLRILPNAVTLFMDTEGADDRNAALSRLAAGSAQDLSAEAEEGRAFAKRVQDLFIGSAGFVVAAPVMALVATAIMLDSPGPVFFRQRRHGFNNEVITVWKFRSMRTDAADATASRQVSKDDDRVTRVGRVIRKLSLDELPQLFNVMSGEMSLVGPRPHAIGMKTAGEEASQLVAEYARRHRVKPGLTGWAQINGSIGAVDTPEAVRRRVALDVEYIETQSFWMDIYILAMTIPALVCARNVVR